MAAVTGEDDAAARLSEDDGHNPISRRRSMCPKPRVAVVARQGTVAAHGRQGEADDGDGTDWLEARKMQGRRELDEG